MFPESVIWKNFNPLDHPEISEMLSESSYVFFEIADSGNEDISEPERLSVVLKPLRGLQCLLVASTCKCFMPFIVELLAVKKHLSLIHI